MQNVTMKRARTFTILHINDLHSNLVGVGPVSEYTPDKVNDDKTIGGLARIATMIAERKRAREAEGPVLTLDIGDFAVGTAFGGATQQLGSELQCLALAGFDATTFGNHDFDHGPGPLAESITAAHKAGHVPTILASNTNLDSDDPELDGLKDLVKTNVIKPHVIIQRGGIKFGLFGIMGEDSVNFTINPGAVKFPDFIETSREMAKQLRQDGADVVICLSHGGVKEPKEGPIKEGDDITLAKAVPEIDVIVGGHTHTFMKEAVVVNGTPVVQAGCYGQKLGELVLEIDDEGKTEVASYKLLDVDDTVLGDPRISVSVATFMAETSQIVFEPRGLKIDEPLAIIDQDWPNSFFDLNSSRPIGNLAADAIKAATKADVAMHAAGLVRAGMIKGSTGVQTAYDIFLLAPLGIGVKDSSAGGSLVVAHLTAREIKNILEFLLVGNPNLPGEYFPRVSGMRFRYDPSRPRFDAVTEIELGDIDQGYRPINISESATQLYSVACNLYFGLIMKQIPARTKGKLSLVPKKPDGSPLETRADVLPERQTGAYLLPPRGTTDPQSAVHVEGSSSEMEIKEWQAIMNHLKAMPTKNEQGVTLLQIDERSMENRSINTRA